MLSEATAVSLRVDALTVQFRGGMGLVPPVSLDVPAGVTVAVTGPNGSGKSTLIRTCAGLIKPKSGSVQWFEDGRPLASDEMRCRLGYVPQSGGLVPAMRVVDYLSYMCWMKGIARADRPGHIERVLRVVDLLPAVTRKVRTLSGGMQRRVLVAQGLLGAPGLLLLDEPTAGLDAQQCVILRDALRAVAGTTTILLATHVVDDLELAAEIVTLGTEMAPSS